MKKIVVLLVAVLCVSLVMPSCKSSHGNCASYQKSAKAKSEKPLVNKTEKNS